MAFSRERVPAAGSGSAGPRINSADPRFAGKDALQQGDLEFFPVHPNREKL